MTDARDKGLREIVAEAITDRWMQKIDDQTVMVGPPVLADAILSALSSAGLPTKALEAVLAGTSAIVPVEATDEMTGAWAHSEARAFRGTGLAHAHARKVWSAMVARSLQAQQEKETG